MDLCKSGSKTPNILPAPLFSTEEDARKSKTEIWYVGALEYQPWLVGLWWCTVGTMTHEQPSHNLCNQLVSPRETHGVSE